METTKIKEKKLLEYKLNKEIEYSKGGSFLKTKVLYCLDPKEIKWSQIDEHEEDAYNLMDLIDKYESIAQRQVLLEQEQLNKNKSEVEIKKESNIAINDLKKLKEAFSKEELDKLIVLNKLSMAKSAGLPTFKLKEQCKNLMGRFMFVDKELTIPITKDDVMRELGLEYKSVMDFFLAEVIILYIVSETGNSMPI